MIARARSFRGRSSVLGVCFLGVLQACSSGADSSASGGAENGGGSTVNGGTSAGGATGSGGMQQSQAGTGAAGASAGGSGGSSLGAGGSNLGGATSAGAGGLGGETNGAGRGGASGSAGTTSNGGSAGGGNDCNTPPAPSPLVGWASQSGMGVATTTGGGDSAPQTVTTLADLNSAAGGTNQRVIYVKGKLAAGTVKVGSNKTIVGLCGAELHGHVDMGGSVNVIFRNLKVVGYNCSDSPSECKSGADAITVNSSAHHLWFDHDDISDGSDGNLDITNGSDFVTVSWTKFWYSTKRTDPVTGTTGHRFSNLIGAADGLAIDVGHLNVTWHHDWWADNVAERMPRSRDGQIHVVNNLYTASGNDYCTNSGNLSKLLVENNVYLGVSNPLQEDADGNMLARGNVFTNTSGSKTATGTGFVPPYALTPESTTSLEATIRAQAGPR